MSTYKNNYIQLNDLGIDLLRNSYAYKHIDFYNIDKYRIEDGFLLRNRILILLMGILIILGGAILLINQFDLIINLFDFHNNFKFNRGFALILSLPIFLFISGIIMLYQSMIRSKLLIIESDGNTYVIRMKEFEKVNQISEIVDFLSNRIKHSR